MLKKLPELLERFKNLTPPQRSIKKAFVKAAEEVAHLSVSLEDVEVRRGIIYLRVPSVIKNEVFLNKKEILENLNSKLNTAKLSIKEIF